MSKAEIKKVVLAYSGGLDTSVIVPWLKENYGCEVVYFAGGAYEVQANGTTEQVIKYYTFAGMSVAMDDGAELKYFLTDHLGPIVAVADSTGAILSEQRYLPFGQVRTDVGTITQTDFGYTGQRDLDAQSNTFSLGLMDYDARFYSQTLGRFIQADSIVTSGPQGLNRYAYVGNNPISRNDPSGHRPCEFSDGEICLRDGSIRSEGNKGVNAGRKDTSSGNKPFIYYPNPADYGITLNGWSDANTRISISEIEQISGQLWDEYATYCRSDKGWKQGCSYSNSTSLFKGIFGGLSINYNINHEWTPCDVMHIGITCGSLAGYALEGQLKHQITHEFGHIFNSKIGGTGVSELESPAGTIYAAGNVYVSGWTLVTGWQRTADGYACNGQPCMQHPIIDELGHSASEDYADMFMNWVWNSFANDIERKGSARYQWMDDRMGGWIYGFVTGP